MTHTVVIADDHELVRDGLRDLLSAQSELEVVGEAGTGEEAVRLCGDLRPDVVVMDLQMPGIGGVEATRRIRELSPNSAVLVLTMFEDDTSVVAALRAGARGYVLKGAERQDIVRAVQSVARGDALFGGAVANLLLDRAAATAETETSAVSGLTEREREVLTLLADGLPNAAIARRLFLSQNTVRNHLSNVFAKLGVSSRSEAIIVARSGWVGRQPSGGRWLRARTLAPSAAARCEHPQHVSGEELDGASRR